VNAIGTVPRDGTLLREESGAISVIVGGAAFHVPDPATLARLFPGTAWHPVWNGATAVFPAVPVNGTLLREESSATTYLILNGARKVAPAGSPGAIHVLWNGALNQIPMAPGIIQGVIRGSDGSALNGATVLVGSIRAVADSGGAFSATLSPGVYQVSATAPAYLPSAVIAVTLQAGATVVENIILQKVKPYTFTGKVTDIKGTPVGGATLTIWEADAGVPGRYTAVTNPAGLYTITIDPGPYQGAYSVSATAAGFANSAGVRLAPVSGQTMTQNFMLSRPGVIAGKVIQSDNGQGIAGARVAAGAVAASTDATGAYSISIPNPGPCALSVTAAGFEPASSTTVTVANDTVVTQNFNLVKAQPGTVAGVITNMDTGKGMRATVTLRGTGAPVSVMSDISGSYSAIALSGPVSAMATANGFIADLETIRVVAGKTITVNFPMQPSTKPPRPGPAPGPGPKPELVAH
jgi:hypothetical protein